jgi:Cu+-exporting ATPase
MDSHCCSCSSKNPIPDSGRRRSNEWLRFGIGAALGGLTMSLSLGLNISPPEGSARFALHSLLIGLVLSSLVALGGPMIAASWSALRQGRITTDQLFFLGIAGAFGASVLSTWRGRGDIYYEVVIILLAIHALGRLLVDRERASAVRTLNEWRRALDIGMRVNESGEKSAVSLGSLRIGEWILIKPGETVPMDGVIVRGSAYVQETAHTGEPFPLARSEDDQVLAGSTVLDGELILRVTATHVSREIDRVADAVAALSAGKSRTERVVDRAVSIFLPIVVVLSLVTFATWLWFVDPIRALFNALAVLLVACPCALGIAIPLAQSLGFQGLARLGVSPHCPSLLEALAGINTVVFDKTGTLTELQLETDGVELISGDESIRGYIAEIQRHSNHPVARPFWSWDAPVPDRAKLEFVKIIPGIGLKGHFTVEGKPHSVAIGNENCLNLADRGALKPSSQRRLFVRFDNQLVAIISLRESLRPGLIQLFNQLKLRGNRIAILTGDTLVPVEFSEFNIEIKTNLSAKEKSEYVEKLKQQGHRVLFVGDGLNDAEVMARADASLAIGTSHPAATDAADGVWGAKSLALLPEALDLADQTKKKVLQIIRFSLAYNLIGLSFAVMGLIHPVLAATLMLVSSLTVTTIANLGAPKPKSSLDRIEAIQAPRPSPSLDPVPVGESS